MRPIAQTKRNDASTEPVGSNIYKDNKGRIVYFNPLTKKAWFIPKYEFKKFNMYRLRYIIVIAAVLVLFTILNDWFELPIWVTAVIGVAGFIGVEFSFQRYLKTLQPDLKFNKQKLMPTEDLNIDGDAKTKTILKAVLYVALGVLLVVNAYQMKYDTYIIYFCWAAMVFFIGYAIYTLIRMSRIIARNKAKAASR